MNPSLVRALIALSKCGQSNKYKHCTVPERLLKQATSQAYKGFEFTYSQTVGFGVHHEFYTGKCASFLPKSGLMDYFATRNFNNSKNSHTLDALLEEVSLPENQQHLLEPTQGV